MANEKYKITVTKDHLVFCSGHFISYENSKCERIHGHNYRAKIEIEGKLDENHYVFDFIALKHRTKEITDLLDHRMMLAKNNKVIEVREEGTRVCVKYKEKEWVFPCRRLRNFAHIKHHCRTTGALYWKNPSRKLEETAQLYA